jgi:glycosyltransferase involved in cell wall biosynthesis
VAIRSREISVDRTTVVYLAAGAAGMYCGSCLHDNRLVAALRAQGRDVVLLPLYTPLRTDEDDVSSPRVFYGGINVYLQQVAGLFRHTPAVLDRLLDVPALLRSVGRMAARTRPEVLGELTLSVLRGADGRQRKELGKLIVALRRLRPGLVHLPNLMFVGIAPALQAALDVTVLCGLTGEDIFLDRLLEPYRTAVFELIRARAGRVDAFVSLTDYYARHAAAHFGLPADRVRRIPMGIHAADFIGPPAPLERPFTVGYLARVCPAKGLAALVQAFVLLRRRGRDCRLRAAGYLGAADKPYLAWICDTLRAANLDGGFEYVGEVSRAQKLSFLRSVDVLSVPTSYAESKGFYVLEALAAGVPVVQPAHGSFPELIAATGGGVLYEPGNMEALADALAGLIDDVPRRQRLAAQGRAAVQRDFTAQRMAAEAWRLYERLV